MRKNGMPVWAGKGKKIDCPVCGVTYYESELRLQDGRKVCKDCYNEKPGKRR